MSKIPNIKEFTLAFYKKNKTENFEEKAMRCIRAYAKIVRKISLEEAANKATTKKHWDYDQYTEIVDREAILKLEKSDNLKIK